MLPEPASLGSMAFHPAMHIWHPHASYCQLGEVHAFPWGNRLAHDRLPGLNAGWPCSLPSSPLLEDLPLHLAQ